MAGRSCQQRAALALAAAALLLAACPRAYAQSCGNIDAKARGAGSGGDDSSIFNAMEQDPSVGIIYLQGNTQYHIGGARRVGGTETRGRGSAAVAAGRSSCGMWPALLTAPPLSTPPKKLTKN